MTVSNMSQSIRVNKRNVWLSGKFPVTLAEIQGFSGKRGHSYSYLNCSLPFHVINPCNSQLSGTQLLERMCHYLPIIPVICAHCLCRIPAVEPPVLFPFGVLPPACDDWKTVMHLVWPISVFPTTSRERRGRSHAGQQRRPLHHQHVNPLSWP